MANIRFDEIGKTTSTTSTDSDTPNTNDAATLRRLTAKGNRKLDKKTVKPKTKTVVTPGTKVSQATIDKIKAMGMKKALAGAGGASAEMREGLKRLYGAKRVGAAAPAKPQSARPQLGGGSKPPIAKPQLGGGSKPPIAKPQLGGGMSKASVKPAAKKSTTTDPLAKFVFGLGKKSGASSNNMNASQVAAENKRRAAAVAASKAKGK